MSAVEAAAPLASSHRTRRRPAFISSPSLVVGLAIVGVVLIAGTWFGIAPPCNPNQTGGVPFAGPTAEHWLGTDNLGRDTFTRVVLAGRSAVFTSAMATLVAASLGALVGLAAGFTGGATDSVVMRVVDGALAIPGILVALILRVILGAGTWQLIVAMAVIYAPSIIRIMRAPALQLRHREFVSAARVSGLPGWRILLVHVAPNSLSPLLVQAASIASSAVALEAVLSYLGQGIQPPEPSAGRMIFEFQTYMQKDPLLVAAPAALILLLSFGWNLIADGLQSRHSLTAQQERR